MVEQTRYYDQTDHWDHDYHQVPIEQQRLRETIELIPDDVESLVDVGCGNGAFLNALPARFRTLGIDFSGEALKHVRGDTLLSDIRALDVPDASYDLVTCLEVLEHLNRETYTGALAEMERVARKYILVSVPNRQNLDLFLVICPACRCQFNPSCHVRSFTPADLTRLFKTFAPISIRDAGPLELRNNLPVPVVAAYRAILREPIPRTAICPQCGYQEIAANGATGPASSDGDNRLKDSASRRAVFRSLASPLRLAGRLLWRPIRQKRWLIALFKAA
jgi:SAM-dependent methyltransferase